jgi:pyruvate dehydrogenase E2 component (dihydrolipoamide acetyltransferase)
MAQSLSTIAHVTDNDDADVTELDRLRRGYPAPENGNRKITMLAFIVRAVARALTMHPAFNAVFDGENDQIIYRRYINISIAVHTARGLITPVIRNTDQLSIIEIAEALGQVAEKARGASFAVNDTRGGTYTISNPGALGGSRYSTPIIPPGQCAVLALGRTRQMPWVVDGAIQPRLIMPLSHSFDHRIADGGDEIAFMQQVIGSLESPARLLL